MKTLTAAQMREADRRCIEELGIPGAVLMNNAGRAVFKEVGHGPVGIVCGKGNNGGDGFVVARLALLAGMEPRVVLLGKPEALADDAAMFCQVYRRLGGHLDCCEEPGHALRAVESLADCSCLVDAMLGTGFKGEVHGAIRAAIEAWPDLHTVAVDLPSGLDSDTGDVAGPCIRADVTVTFQFAKRGFLNPSAQRFLGRLVIADIGIPNVCADDTAWNLLKANMDQNASPLDTNNTT